MRATGRHDGSSYGAGIGGGDAGAGGTVTIYGGIVEAEGGSTGGAGIGGGRAGSCGGTVTVWGGEVTATGSLSGGAGIGGGWHGHGGHVAVHGGRVTARAGNSYGSGIGGGSSGCGGTVEVSGGTVYASRCANNTGYQDIGGKNGSNTFDNVFTGGSVYLAHGTISNLPVNVESGGERVYCVTVTGLTANEEVAFTGPDGYGTEDIFADEAGKVYLWLPNGYYAFTAGGVGYGATVAGANTTAKPIVVVTFDAGGGGGADSSTTSNRAYAIGEAYGSFPEATRPYYDFAGWTNASGTAFTTNDIASATVSNLYASWTRLEWTDAVAIDTDWFTGALAGTVDFTIDTAAELGGFAAIINGDAGTAQTNFAGCTVTLAADIDLDGRYWMPVGGIDLAAENAQTFAFAGTFDGADTPSPTS